MAPATAIEPTAARVHSGDESLYELIDGRRVEIAPMGVHESWIASVLMFILQKHADPSQLGRAVVEALFDLGLPARQRRPDVAYVSTERWPYNRPPPRSQAAWHVVPDLAIELVSPSNTADEIVAKLHDYFLAGVRLVWVIYPDPGEVYVYESPQKISILTRADVLDAGQILPGFRLPLSDLLEAQVTDPTRP